MIKKIIGCCVLVIFHFGIDLYGMKNNQDKEKEPLLLNENEHNEKCDYKDAITLLKLSTNPLFMQKPPTQEVLCTAFFDALMEHDLESVGILLNAKPIFIHYTKDDHTALYYAVEFEDVDLMVLFLEHGAVISESVVKHAKLCASEIVQHTLTTIQGFLEYGEKWDWTSTKKKEVYQGLLNNIPSIDLYKIAHAYHKDTLAKKLEPLHNAYGKKVLFALKKKNCFIQ